MLMLLSKAAALLITPAQSTTVSKSVIQGKTSQLQQKEGQGEEKRKEKWKPEEKKKEKKKKKWKPREKRKEKTHL